jgi:type I restriction enzyme S subunit
MINLPNGWRWSTCGDAAGPGSSIMDGPFGSKLKTEHYVATGVRVVRLGNIQPLRFMEADLAFISPERFQELKNHQVNPGDVLIAALGEPLGRACIAPIDIGTAIVKADCLRYRPGNLLLSTYLVYWLNSPDCRDAIDSLSHGMGRKRINTQDLRKVPLPLPPSPSSAASSPSSTACSRARRPLVRSWRGCRGWWSGMKPRFLPRLRLVVSLQAGGHAT